MSSSSSLKGGNKCTLQDDLVLSCRSSNKSDGKTSRQFMKNENKDGSYIFIPKRTNSYVIEKLCSSHGYLVVCIPPHHCQYNPTEYVWVIAKKYYERNIGQNSLVMKQWKKCAG